MTTPPDAISPVIGHAGRVLREYGDQSRWPRSVQARKHLAWDRDYLADTLHAHARLMETGVTGQFEDEQAAIDAAEDAVAQAEEALRRTWLRYQPAVREVAA